MQKSPAVPHPSTKAATPAPASQRTPKSGGDTALPQDRFRIPRPTLALQTLHNAPARSEAAQPRRAAGGEEDGWGSDFDDVSWTPEEQRYFDARFSWEDRQMAGVAGEKPPVPPRSGSKEV